MSNCIVVPICFSKEVLNKIDEAAFKDGLNRKKGRRFNRSEFIVKGMEQYLDSLQNRPQKINYFRKAEEKLERILKK
jgi:hypothetical protein